MSKKREFVLKGIVDDTQGFLSDTRIAIKDGQLSWFGTNILRMRLKDKSLFPFRKHDVVEIVIRRRKA